MDLHNVNSSVLSAVGYDDDGNTLEVRFRNGRIYRYFDVPAAVFDKLLTAPSVGQYYNRFVRNRFAVELVYDPEG